MIGRVRESLQSFLSVGARYTPISDSQTILCPTCAALDLRKILRDGLPRENMVSLGTVLDITKKSDRCGFCRLIADLFRRRWQLDSFPDTDLQGIECSVFAHECGTLDPDLDERKRAHRLYFSATRPRDITRILITTQAELGLDIQLLKEDARKLGRSKDVHGRRVEPKVDIRLIKKWIALCERYHGEDCSMVWWKAGGGDLPEFVRMVDVVQMALVHAGRACRYVALSYVWGGPGDDYWTTSTNIESRGHRFGLQESILPATIVDAIQVTHQLGERYLWIDALCIIQDSHEDKAAQISIMDRVYSQALFTLIAASGASVRDGLSGVRTGSRTVDQHVECVQDLHLSIPLPPLVEALGSSRWNTRGWTFQEDILSRRRLYFTKHQMYFACTKDVWCEDLVAESKTLKWTFHPIRYHNTSLFSRSPNVSPSMNHRSYENAVGQYTQRYLTVESDIMDAVGALTSVMTRAMEPAGSDPKNAFRFGMWIRNLDLTLLWQPKLDVVHTRRTMACAEYSRWPSWAWSGWKGAAHYQNEGYLISGIDSDVQQAPSQSLVTAWNMINENGKIIQLDVKQIPPSWSVDGNPDDNALPPFKYAPTQNNPSDLVLDFVPPKGTLIFRTQCAPFQVLRLNNTALAGPSAPTAHTLFHILPADEDQDQASPRYAGRIVLPVSTPSPSVLELVVLSRCGGRTSELWDERAWGKSYEGCLLYVMAVQRMRDDARVCERVGVGIVVEYAWMNSSAEERVVLLA